MKSIVYTKYGLPDVLQLMEVAKPEPKDDQVLVEVHAASVNALDYRRFGKLSTMGYLMEERHSVRTFPGWLRQLART
jgi:NADPH:quinone reductase-like Zn-dependent oxidoreductase